MEINRNQLAKVVGKLLERMNDLGQNHVADLSFAEATLFHTATDLLDTLCQSIDA